ncbi:hypothetical protein [Spiroplasma endosymbiont of Nephrotoma flavescens]|uniref:hypothetical protein n=1 Tax=Spiroplasma endosymbiont of Nephrotoma flavescens TaxID=3066302 RepID=UPI00313EC523
MKEKKYMKKLLSLLSVITISGSTMPLLLAISPTKKSIDNFISKKDLEEAGPSNRICCDSSDANNSENDENKTIDDLKNLSDLIVFLGLEIKKCKINSLSWIILVSASKCWIILVSASK